MKRLALCTMALQLVVVSCFADVIPSRRQETNPAAEQMVKARLEQVGLSSTDADRQVRELSSREVAYFAGHPDRVQMAGALYWYEWVAGAVVVVLVTGTIIALKINPE